MERNLKQQAEQMAVRSARQSKSKHLLAIPAVLVAAVTALMLMSPALAMERTAVCGKAEHVHEDACYEQALICGFEQDQLITPEAEDGAEVEAHTHQHTDVCYGPVLVCGTEEHVHDDSCYADEAAETEGEELLVAASPEPVCGIEEHAHEEACYDENGELICGKEEHTHSIDCLADPAETEADPETEPEVETAEAADIATPETSDMVEIEDDLAPLELQTVKVFEDKQVRITATYDPDALPEGAELKAFPITAEDHPEEYTKMLADAGVTVEVNEETGEVIAEKSLVLYGIGFYVNGEEVEPQTPVDIRMEFIEKDGFTVGDNVEVIHFADGGMEVLESEADSQNNAASFQTGSFSPFMLFGTGVDAITGETEETVMDSLTRLVSNVMMIAQVSSSQNLKDFLSQFDVYTVTDSGSRGEQVKPGETLYDGEKYEFSLKFQPSATMQFGDSPLKLDLVTEHGIRLGAFEGGEGQIVIDGTAYPYTYHVDNNGVLWVEYSDELTEAMKGVLNASFDITLDTEFYVDESGTVEIPLTGKLKATFETNSDPQPTVEKTVGNDGDVKWDDSSERYYVEYTVRISAEHCDLEEGSTFRDELHCGSDSNSTNKKRVLEYIDPVTCEVTVYDKNGEKLSKESREAESWRHSDSKNSDGQFKYDGFEVQNLPGLDKGQYMDVTYRAYLTKEESDQLRDHGQLNITKQKNDVDLLPPGEDEPIESSASVDLVFESVTKKGSLAEGSTVKWTVTFDDNTRHDYLGAPVTDTVSGGTKFSKDNNTMTFSVRDENGNKLFDFERTWDGSQLSNSDQTLTYKLPTLAELQQEAARNNQTLPENYALRVEYYTTYTENKNESQTFVNTVTSQYREAYHTATGSVNTAGPIGDIRKTILNAPVNGQEIKDTITENGYIEFEVTVPNIPAKGENGKPAPNHTEFRFDDNLVLHRPSDNETFYVQSEPENLEVYLKQGDDDEVLLPFHSVPYGSGDKKEYGEDNAYLVRTESTVEKDTEHGRFLLVFNTNDIGTYVGEERSSLYIMEDATLRVHYRIPLTALVYDSSDSKNDTTPVGMLGELLDQGYLLTNTAEAQLRDSAPAKATVNYQNPKYTNPVVKTGRILEDGNIEYRVEFKNWYVDSNDPTKPQKSGTAKADAVLKTMEDVQGLIFTDDYDDRLTYVNGSLCAYVYDDEGRICAKYAYTGNDPKRVDDKNNKFLSATGGEFNERVIPAAKGAASETVYDNGATKFNFELEEGTWGVGKHYYAAAAQDSVNHTVPEGTRPNSPTLAEGIKGHADNEWSYYNIVFVYVLQPDIAGLKQLPVAGVDFENYVTINAQGEDYPGNATVRYPTGALTKTGEQQTGANNKASDIIKFTIEMNANEVNLLPEGVPNQPLTLHDQMSANLSFRESSLHVYIDGNKDEEVKPLDYSVEIMEDGSTLLTIRNLENGKHYLIEYETQIKTGTGFSHVSNEVWLGDVKGDGDNFEQNFNVEQTTSIGEGSTGSIHISKVDETTKQSLEGAEFRLYISPLVNDDGTVGGDPRKETNRIGGVNPEEFAADETIEYDDRTYYLLGVTPNGTVQQATQKTDSAGRVKINSGYLIDYYTGDKGYSFILVEVKAPVGYELPAGDDRITPFCFGAPSADSLTYQVVYDDGSIVIENTSYTTELPETGGEGTTAYTVSGLALLGAALWLYSRRRKAETH